MKTKNKITSLVAGITLLSLSLAEGERCPWAYAACGTYPSAISQNPDDDCGGTGGGTCGYTEAGYDIWCRTGGSPLLKCGKRPFKDPCESETPVYQTTNKIRWEGSCSASGTCVNMDDFPGEIDYADETGSAECKS